MWCCQLTGDCVWCVRVHVMAARLRQPQLPLAVTVVTGGTAQAMNGHMFFSWACFVLYRSVCLCV